MQSTFKSKLVVCLLSLFLPGTGLHWLYLKGKSSPWFYLQLFALLMGVWAWFELAQTEKSSILGWIGVALGEISMLASWLATLALGLRPDDRFDAQFNSDQIKKNQSGWLVIMCLMAALMIGAFVLMSGLAIAFEQYFVSQIEAAKEISQ
jgi:cobalamin synthase